MASKSASDFRHLSLAERLQLVEDLWDSIAEEADTDTLPLTAEEQRLLDQRLAEHERHPNEGASWEDTKARILKRYHKRDR